MNHPREWSPIFERPCKPRKGAQPFICAQYRRKHSRKRDGSIKDIFEVEYCWHIHVMPIILFPLLWLSPLGLLLGIQCLRKDQTCFQSLARGDWRPVLLSALAALFCGFWWELWNVYSLVHWEYTIPYVHALKIFEMPVLGYSGYLPFGLTCLAISEFGLDYQLSHQLRISVVSNQDTA